MGHRVEGGQGGEDPSFPSGAAPLVLSLSLEKGLPLGSGMGSSAASAAAAAEAVRGNGGRHTQRWKHGIKCMRVA